MFAWLLTLNDRSSKPSEPALHVQPHIKVHEQEISFVPESPSGLPISLTPQQIRDQKLGIKDPHSFGTSSIGRSIRRRGAFDWFKLLGQIAVAAQTGASDSLTVPLQTRSFHAAALAKALRKSFSTLAKQTLSSDPPAHLQPDNLATLDATPIDRPILINTAPGTALATLPIAAEIAPHDLMDRSDGLYQNIATSPQSRKKTKARTGWNRQFTGAMAARLLTDPRALPILFDIGPLKGPFETLVMALALDQKFTSSREARPIENLAGANSKLPASAIAPASTDAGQIASPVRHTIRPQTELQADLIVRLDHDANEKVVTDVRKISSTPIEMTVPEPKFSEINSRDTSDEDGMRHQLSITRTSRDDRRVKYVDREAIRQKEGILSKVGRTGAAFIESVQNSTTLRRFKAASKQMMNSTSKVAELPSSATSLTVRKIISAAADSVSGIMRRPQLNRRLRHQKPGDEIIGVAASIDEFDPAKLSHNHGDSGVSLTQVIDREGQTHPPHQEMTYRLYMSGHPQTSKIDKPASTKDFSSQNATDHSAPHTKGRDAPNKGTQPNPNKMLSQRSKAAAWARQRKVKDQGR